MSYDQSPFRYTPPRHERWLELFCATLFAACIVLVIAIAGAIL